MYCIPVFARGGWANQLTPCSENIASLDPTTAAVGPTVSGDDFSAYQSSLITSSRRITSDRQFKPALAFSVIIALSDAL